MIKRLQEDPPLLIVGLATLAGLSLTLSALVIAFVF